MTHPRKTRTRVRRAITHHLFDQVGLDLAGDGACLTGWANCLPMLLTRVLAVLNTAAVPRSWQASGISSIAFSAQSKNNDCL